MDTSTAGAESSVGLTESVWEDEGVADGDCASTIGGASDEFELGIGSIEELAVGTFVGLAFCKVSREELHETKLADNNRAPAILRWAEKVFGMFVPPFNYFYYIRHNK